MARRLLDGLGMREHRLRTCGYSMAAGRTFKRGADGKVRSVGITRCGNSRVCPVCGPAVAAVRAAATGAAVWRWMTASDEHAAIFVSLAASHRSTDRLEDLHDQLLVARGRVMDPECPVWRKFRKRFGIVDLAWKIEHSCGENGPHPGLHAILLTERWWTAEDAQAAEAWLLIRFRAELAGAGFEGRLSASAGIDIRPVDDPAGVGQYLAKWGIGSELASESAKLGRNGTSVPYNAIPSVLAAELGNNDPTSAYARRNPRTRRLVDGWGEFVAIAVTDTRKWYKGFRRLTTLVSELKTAHTDRERIAVCTRVLPDDLRPERHDDGESEDDDAEGERLTVSGDAWAAALRRWWRPRTLPWSWVQRRRRWCLPDDAPPIPLELAIAWLAEDEGMAGAAVILAELAGAEVTHEEYGVTVDFTID